VGNSQLATTFNVDKVIPPLEALLCGPGLQTNLPALSFFLEKKEQGQRKAILAKQNCVALEHCLK